MKPTFARPAFAISALLLFGAVPVPGVAQPAPTDIPAVQGQQRAPETSIVPRGSPPALTEPGGTNNIRAVAVGDLLGMMVVNDIGEPLGDVRRVISGEAGLIYALLDVDNAEQRAVLPLSLMQIKRDQLVIRGFGLDALRAQPVDEKALADFSEVHSSRVVTFVSLADQNSR